MPTANRAKKWSRKAITRVPGSPETRSLVDQAAQGDREHQRAAGGEHEEDRGRRDAQPVRAQERQQPGERLDAARRLGNG